VNQHHGRVTMGSSQDGRASMARGGRKKHDAPLPIEKVPIIDVRNGGKESQ